MSDVEDAVDQILAQWGRERPDLDCSPMGIIGRISQMQREVFLAQRATFGRYGLDAPSFDVLAALRQEHLALQLADPPDDPHRRAVQIGPLPSPLGEDQVDGILHVAHRSSPPAPGIS